MNHNTHLVWFRYLAVIAVLVLVAAPGLAQTTRRAATRTQDPLKINLAWQIALEAANFSPGVIDGKFGTKSQVALREYAARYFPGLDVYDRKVFTALGVDVEHATTTYTVTADDAADVGPLPEDWNEKAKLTKLTYSSLADGVAEKFHCHALLQTLNPGVNLERIDVGTTLVVPNIRPFPGSGDAGPATEAASHPAAAYITINLTEKMIRVYDQDDRQLALFHCSVAADKAKLPARDTVVKKMAQDPDYTFDPKNWPEVHNVDHILRIPPGPRNPVGVRWIGLDLPGYGIHGNPKPELIGKTGSHGCFRMTNWDAIRLFALVRVGLPVKIINPEKAGTPDTDN